MFSNPDFPVRQPHRLARLGLLASIAIAMLAAGCAGRFGPRADDATGAIATPAAAPQPCLPISPLSPVAPQASDAVTRMLAYADRLRRLAPAELSQEVIQLGDAAGPTQQLQLALVLSQLHQLSELIRAQELLGRVLANADTEAQTLHPLAGLLASRYGEQRRLEEQLEKQTQQTRDMQRRLDQTNERLEALKAIERSLTSRPPAASAPAPGNRGIRPATP